MRMGTTTRALIRSWESEEIATSATAHIPCPKPLHLKQTPKSFHI